MLQGKRGLLGKSTWRQGLYSRFALNDSLISFWKMDEATGAVRADSIALQGANNLTNNNNVSQVAGKIGNASQFTLASSQYLSIADNPTLRGGTSFSWALWFYMDTLPASLSMLVAKSANSGNGSYVIYWNNASSRIVFGVTKADGSADISATANNFGAPSTATWYFLAAVYDSGTDTASISINNGTPNTATGANGGRAGTYQLNIGAHDPAVGGAERYWDGRLDAIGFWRKALSPNEISLLYNGGTGRETPF